MELKDLKPSLLELPKEQALELILKIRASRIENKKVIKERAKAVSKAETDLSSMSIEQLEALMKKLKETV